MSIYYIKQDNTVWCCEEDSGPYNQEIDISFVKCECPQVEPETMAEHLQGHQGGGQVLKWRKANENERSAWYGGKDEVFDEGIEFESDYERADVQDFTAEQQERFWRLCP